MKIPHLRWLVAFALGMAAVLNYIDRNVLALLAPTIQKDLSISDEQYAEGIKRTGMGKDAPGGAEFEGEFREDLHGVDAHVRHADGSGAALHAQVELQVPRVPIDRFLRARAVDDERRVGGEAVFKA